MEDDEINEHGRFWRVEEAVGDGRMTPANTIDGTLKIDANGKITLRRDPALVPDCGIPEAWPEGSIILDYLPHSNKFVRLESRPGTYRLCLIGDSPLAGTPPIDNCVNVQVPLDGFDDWLRLTSPIPVPTEDGGFILKSGLPQKRTYYLPAISADLDICYRWLVSTHRATQTLTGRGMLEVRPRTPRTLHEIAESVAKLEDLLRLFTDRDRSFGWPQVKRQEDDGWYKFYYHWRSQRGRAEIDRFETWVLFPCIKEKFGEIADAWFKKYECLTTTFNNYLATRRGAAPYLEHQFASLVWGMEAMSRGADGAGANSNLLEKIKRIRQEPSLKDRLFRLFQSLPLDLSEDTLKDFAERCAKMRNDLSHYGGQREKNPISSKHDEFTKNLIDFIFALDLLCHARILQEIKVPDNIISLIFRSASSSSARRRRLLEAAGLQVRELPPSPPDKTSGGASG